ncbi:MAG TPA: hypothetical protein VGQ00_00740 [Candidatus Norongarragalinales archaeon]|nr:hypothetical protein [Candidatus Norongarragalinales archaeon]
MVQRIFQVELGGRRVHLLRLAGGFFVLAALLMLAQSVYALWVVLSKITWVQLNPDSIAQLFGWAIGAPYGFGVDDIVGVLMGPLASVLFWVGTSFVAIMIYRAGGVIFPVEEHEQRIAEHHRRLIEKVVRSHKRR